METTGPKPTDELQQYVAGYCDGEASFMYRDTPIVDVSSVYPYTLRLFSSRYGGTILTRKRSGDHLKTAYQWRVFGDNAIRLIKEVLPHLKEKRAQALLVLEIRQTEPGVDREGLIAQLKGFKKLEYNDEA